MTDMSTGPGNTATKVYNDMEPADIREILSFDESHIHRDVEAAVVAAAAQHNVKAAIISPPMIHGTGNGPVKRRSIQVPILIEKVLKRGKSFQILEGQNIWNSIHISDLSTAIIVLLEETLKGPKSNMVWLPEGYYFVEDAEFVCLLWPQYEIHALTKMDSNGRMSASLLPRQRTQRVSFRAIK